MTRRALWFVPASLALAAVACDRSVVDTGPNGETGEKLVNTPCTEAGQRVACMGDAVTTCVQGDDGSLRWAACQTPDCEAGDVQSCQFDPSYGEDPNAGTIPGQEQCVPLSDGHWVYSQDCEPIDSSTSAATPLVFSFDGASVVYDDAEGAFGLDPTQCIATDWPSAATPWLALDRNGDGRIGDGGELFGSATMLADGTYAKNGFQALAELDENHDGVIDAKDPAFAKLVVWADANRDRRSDPSELRSLASLGIESIDLRYAIDRRCDARQNCEVESARFVYRATNGARREGRVIDVHLAIH